MTTTRQPSSITAVATVATTMKLTATPADVALRKSIPTATVLSQTIVGPDGAAVDAEGGVWFADAFGQRAARVVDGEIVARVDVGTGVYAVALGGEDGRTLFLCTAPSFAEHERRTTREAQLLAVTVEVPAP